MAKKKLGRGLSALLPEQVEETNQESGLIKIALSDITTNPFQPRTHFNDKSIDELAASIKENGVIQPIVVRKVQTGFELISGERRLRATKSLGEKVIPAIVKENVSDKESMLMALIENIQREDISPIEQAESYKLIMKENDMSQTDLAIMIGKSRPVVANTIRLLELSSNCKEALEEKTITESHARKLLQLDTHGKQNKMLLQIMNNSMTIREMETKVISKKAKKNSTPTIQIKNNNYKISCKKSGDKGSFTIKFGSSEEYKKLIKQIETL